MNIGYGIVDFMYFLYCFFLNACASASTQWFASPLRFHLFNMIGLICFAGTNHLWILDNFKNGNAAWNSNQNIGNIRTIKWNAASCIVFVFIFFIAVFRIKKWLLSVRCARKYVIIVIIIIIGQFGLPSIRAGCWCRRCCSHDWLLFFSSHFRFHPFNFFSK